MTKMICTLALAAALSTNVLAADFKGYIIDQMCAAKPAMRGNVECATKCIKGGSPAVLVTEDGKIYKIADQAKVVPLAGKQVTITGSLSGDTITVTGVQE
jgi:uncharacterized protein DUF5818